MADEARRVVPVTAGIQTVHSSIIYISKRLALRQQEHEHSAVRKKGMCIELLERSCVLIIRYMKRRTTEGAILGTGIVRVHHNSQGLT